MKHMTLSEAFAFYKAKLKNRNWSVSAENADGELVLSLWSHHFSAIGNIIRYVDKVSRWAGPGNKEFRERIEKAYSSGQTVRAVIARTNDESAVETGKDTSKLKKTFSVKKDWFGKVVVWDGDSFEIEFTYWYLGFSSTGLARE
jgi:hypothetical protein